MVERSDLTRTKRVPPTFFTIHISLTWVLRHLVGSTPLKSGLNVEEIEGTVSEKEE